MGAWDEAITAFTRGVIAWRRTVLILCLLAATAAVWGTRHLTFTADYRVYFSGDNPDLAAFERFEDAYVSSENLIIALRPRDGELFTRERLAMIHALTESAWRLPHATRVDSLTNFQRLSAEGDELRVADLVTAPSSLSEAELARIERNALDEPALVGRLLSKDAATTGVFVTLKFPEDDHADHLTEAVEAAYALADRYQSEHPDVEFATSGVAAFSYAEVEMSRADIERLMPFMFALMAVSLLLLLRSFTGLVATMTLIVLSSGVAMGMAGWMGIRINASSAMAPTIILTLAVADSVHILTTILDEMRSGRDKLSAIVESIRLNAQPVFLTSLTTAIGFLSLNFSDAPPFRDLGNITAIGIGAAWVYAMLLLPALIAILPVGPRRRAGAGRETMTRLGRYVVARAKPVFAIALASALALIAFIPTLEVDDQFLNWFDEGTKFRESTDFITENLTGPYTVEFSVPARGDNGITEPEYLRHLDRFAGWLEEQKEVVHVDHFARVTKRLNRAMHGDRNEWYRIPESRPLAAQYLFLYELSLPPSHDLTTQVDFHKSASRVTVTLDRVSSNRIEAFADRATRWMKDNLPAYMQTQPTGTIMLFTQLTERNIRAMFFGTVLAIVLIAATIIVALRSVRLGLVSLVPNALPVMLAIGLWAVLVGEIGLIVSIIAVITLGLIVDDTVHILSKYKRARRERGFTTDEAIVYVFSHTGNAILITTVVISAGFLVLCLSDFRLNSDMGLLTSITLAFALVMDLALLPPILMALGVDRRTERGRRA